MPPKKKPATTMKTPAKTPATKAKASRGTAGRKTTAANNNKAGAPKRRPAAATTGTTTATAAAAAATTTVRGYWSENEEGALKRAVRKHGIGAWEKMRNDPEFATLRCVRARAAANLTTMTI